MSCTAVAGQRGIDQSGTDLSDHHLYEVGYMLRQVRKGNCGHEVLRYRSSSGGSMPGGRVGNPLPDKRSVPDADLGADRVEGTHDGECVGQGYQR